MPGAVLIKTQIRRARIWGLAAPCVAPPCQAAKRPGPAPPSPWHDTRDTRVHVPGEKSWSVQPSCHYLFLLESGLAVLVHVPSPGRARALGAVRAPRTGAPCPEWVTQEAAGQGRQRGSRARQAGPPWSQRTGSRPSSAPGHGAECGGAVLVCGSETNGVAPRYRVSFHARHKTPVREGRGFSNWR